MRPAGMTNPLWPADSCASSLRQESGRRSPDQSSRPALNPLQRTRERMPRPAVYRQHHALVESQYDEHDEGLLEQRLGTDSLVLERGNETHQREHQGVLSEN